MVDTCSPSSRMLSGPLRASITMATEFEETLSAVTTFVISGSRNVPPLFQQGQRISVDSIGGFPPLDPSALCLRPCGIFLVLSHWDSILKTCVVGRTRVSLEQQSCFLPPPQSLYEYINCRTPVALYLGPWLGQTFPLLLLKLEKKRYSINLI
ncbi:hypothetical protein ElyMa_002512900 [Elysia marginata]|uniref:Uncharacterized protein n=1 Tax=Elysia marginata TaxID=1093978 RepID=A0AAV4GSU7_9GAST|nr:hypothetical protein ElyMa_002512900 [Elysia marginata]